MIPSVVVDKVCVASETVGLYGAEQMPVSEAIVDLVLLAALKQFEYQATNRLLLAASKEYRDSGTTQKKDVPLIYTCICHIIYENSQAFE